LAELERFLVAVVGRLVLSAILLDIAEPRHRRRDRALVAALAAARECFGDLRVRLVVAAEHLQRLADIVERARDAAAVACAAEQLEATLEIFERELEVA